jgi:hypothetical protein
MLNAAAGPFLEEGGLLSYARECQDPGYFLGAPFRASIYGEQVSVDHFVLLFPEERALLGFAEELVARGGLLVEGPGLWPRTFCPELEDFPPELHMHLATVQVPSGGFVVLSAPSRAGDQLSRLLVERGRAVVHHVAIHAADLALTSETWRRKGFVPVTEAPADDGVLCQWFLRNPAGQIIELIERKSDRATFSCTNLSELRKNES